LHRCTYETYERLRNRVILMKSAAKPCVPGNMKWGEPASKKKRVQNMKNMLVSIAPQVKSGPEGLISL
jgi:hypothetical protein